MPESVNASESPCHRCGMCCRAIPLALAPHEFKVQAEANGPDSNKGRVFAMLGDRYIGPVEFITNNGERDYRETRHLYGPCPNLIEVGAESLCAIHDAKPEMCSGYPYYGEPEWKRLVNHVEFKGCGYNRDPDVGFTVDDMVNAARDGTVLDRGVVEWQAPPPEYEPCEAEEIEEKYEREHAKAEA